MTKNILLTGGTGFIGSHLAIKLLEDRNVHLVTLARTKKRKPALERIREALSTALTHQGHTLSDEWRSRIEGVEVLDGELGSEAIKQILNEVPVEAVWHCAGKVAFDTALKEVLDDINTRATQELLRWAADHRCQEFNYVSTAYVAPGGRETAEQFFAPDETANNPYEISKRRAEECVLEAREQHRLPFRIFRPSIVVGHSETGRGATIAGLYGFLMLAERLKQEIASKIPGYFEKFSARLLTSETGDLNIIPIDMAVEQMVAIAGQPTSTDQIYNIVGENNVTIAQVTRHIARELAIDFLATSDEDSMGPMDIIINKEVSTFAPYLRKSYRFSTANVQTSLGTTLRPARIDDALIGRLVSRFFAERPRLARMAANRRGNWLDDFQKHEIQRGGEVLKYYQGGQGTRTVLIINAYGQSLFFWSRLADLLGSDHRVIMWEMRGTSCTAGGMTHAASVMEHVEDALAIAQDAKFDQCDVMAWCTGPKLAMELYRRQPALLRTLTFITPAFKNFPGLESLETTYEKNMEPLCRLAVKHPATITSARRALSAILAGKSTSADLDVHAQVQSVLSLMSEELRTLVVAPFVNDQSLLAYAEQLIHFWDHDVSSFVSEIDLPVLTLTGSRDEIASEQRGAGVTALMKRHLACSFVNGGHYIHFENAPEVATLFKDFSESTDSVIPPQGVKVISRSAA